MPLKDPEARAAYKSRWYQNAKDDPLRKARRAANAKAYRIRHRAKVKKYKREYERHRMLTDPEYREKQRQRSVVASRTARTKPFVKKQRVLHQKARQYKLRSGGVLAKADIEYTLDTYRVGDKYIDVYTSSLISDPTIDHIVPISGGGGNSWDNFAITSAVENSKKGKRSLLIFLLEKRLASETVQVAA